MDVKVIPDFLPEPVFNQLLQLILTKDFAWFFMSNVSGYDLKREKGI